jgi:hypothetical protein
VFGSEEEEEEGRIEPIKAAFKAFRSDVEKVKRAFMLSSSSPIT